MAIRLQNCCGTSRKTEAVVGHHGYNTVRDLITPLIDIIAWANTKVPTSFSLTIGSYTKLHNYTSNKSTKTRRATASREAERLVLYVQETYGGQRCSADLLAQLKDLAFEQKAK